MASTYFLGAPGRVPEADRHQYGRAAEADQRPEPPDAEHPQGAPGEQPDRAPEGEHGRSAARLARELCAGAVNYQVSDKQDHGENDRSRRRAAEGGALERGAL